MATLDLHTLTLRIADKTLCNDITASVAGNERWGLLGRNGAGKTTLLHSLIGQREISEGAILLDEKKISSYSQRELASKIGILMQHGIEALPATVFETVLLGRHPHTDSLLWDNANDIEVAEQSLAAFDLMPLADRQINTLSGGEIQRLALALLLAQTPQIYLLDEPSNHLDVAFQVKLLSVLAEKVSESGASLIMATHDINLAARFCENIILMLEGGETLVGTADEVLTEGNLSEAYGCEIRVLSNDDRRLFYPA